MTKEWEEGSPGEGGDDGAAEAGQVEGVFNVPGMAMGQVFQGKSQVTSIDFHEDGELCVTANSDRQVTAMMKTMDYGVQHRLLLLRAEHLFKYRAVLCSKAVGGSAVCVVRYSAVFS